ncbi:MAG: hypothetical protein HQM09_18115 [Candidatus Riflebacteria bacterium]|nr:hypothetical protein [Candidatus Riflebacteria bacterium]
MRRDMGLWIDHRSAHIVTLNGEEAEMRSIESHMEKHVHPSGGARAKTPYGPQSFFADDSVERQYVNHLGRYYDEVHASLANAKSILIFGPGEAKVELKKKLDQTDLRERIVGVETVDKMTERQIIAKVRQYYLASAGEVMAAGNS